MLMEVFLQPQSPTVDPRAEGNVLTYHPMVKNKHHKAVRCAVPTGNLISQQLSLAQLTGKWLVLTQLYSHKVHNISSIITHTNKNRWVSVYSIYMPVTLHLPWIICYSPNLKTKNGDRFTEMKQNRLISRLVYYNSTKLIYFWRKVEL